VANDTTIEAPIVDYEPDLNNPQLRPVCGTATHLRIPPVDARASYGISLQTSRWAIHFDWA
jgi:hypothetical protein